MRTNSKKRGGERRSSNSPNKHNRSRGRSYGRPSGKSGANRFKKYIDPNHFVNKSPIQETTETYVAVHSFTDFKLNEAILNNLKKAGFSVPTRIQDETIPHILAGRDVVGLANTGSGKTGAFVLPIIEKLYGNKVGKAFVITPTRELAMQVDDEFRKFSQGLRLFSAVCVGGMNIRKQINDLRRKPEVIIGTPGRLKDLFNQRALNLEDVSVLVLDEADRMLDMGFIKDIEFLISKIKVKPQTLCFSATTSPAVKELLEKKLKDPIIASVRTSETGEHIAQDVIRVSSKEEKLSKLEEMLALPHFGKVLIFGETKHGVKRLAEQLSKKGFKAEAIHGNKTQPQRKRALDAFKHGKVDILVATDVAARGLDIPDVSHVINFDTPQSHEDYVHRIGRTGRAGKGGQALTFIEGK
jgi:superfamily II DNA/RNA helicase